MIEKDRYKFEQYLRRNYPKMFMRPFSAIKKTDYGRIEEIVRDKNVEIIEMICEEKIDKNQI